MKGHVTIQIVENNRIIADLLENQLSEFGYLVNPVAHSGPSALSYIKQYGADIVLLDIDLRGAYDGIETARRLGDISNARIIYLTYRYDAERFEQAEETEPIAYVSKPFNVYQLHHTIQMASRSIEGRFVLNNSEQSGCFFIYDKGGYLRIEPDDIVFFKPMGSQQEVHFIDKKTVISITAKLLLEKLARSGIPFQRVHREYVVNINHVRKIDDTSLVIGDQLIPIGQAFKKELFNRLTLLSKARKGA